MSTFVLLSGAGSDSWYWHLVVPLLEERGHSVIPVDLPYGDDTAGQYEYADLVVAAAGAADGPLVLVGQSMSAFTAVIACDRLPVDLLVLVAPMIPAPGESAGQWWESTGQPAAKREQDLREGRDPDAPDDLRALFFHDVPAEVVDEAFRQVEVAMSDTPFETVWRAPRWPQVPTRVVAGRHDRLFPLPLVQRLARDRIGVEPDVIDAGHLVALARPDDLAALLLEYAERG